LPKATSGFSLLLAVFAAFLFATGASAASSPACDRSVQQILRGNYDAALRQLSGAKTSGDAPGEVENLRGLALLLEGQTARALASFDKALELQPSLQPARFNRALALMRNGDHAKAAAALEKVYADEHSALRADAAYHLGIAHDRMGRAAEAEKWLDRAMILDAKLDAALLYVGMLRERRGDLQSAGRAYLDYLERYPKSASALLRFGVSAQKAGRIDVARTYLNELVATTSGAQAALFLDWEGETVELACDHDLSDHELRIIGAYQGIFLSRLRALCAQVQAGEPRRYKIELDTRAVLSYDVKDGYYVVLLVDTSFNEGLAWRRLEKCRERLLAEM